MGGSIVVRAAVCAGSALAAAAFGVSIAGAQEVGSTPAPVNFTESQNGRVEGPTLDLSVRQDPNTRFTRVAPARQEEANATNDGEVELSAGGGNAPLDVSIAQRANFGSDSNGDLNRRGNGSEVRVGRGLVRSRRANASGDHSVYAFVASDDQALTWQPGARSEFGGQTGGVAMQDQVEVGDMSAGVTYEANGVQASLAYVEREERTRVGNRNFSQDQSFAGVTVTMRH